MSRNTRPNNARTLTVVTAVVLFVAIAGYLLYAQTSGGGVATSAQAPVAAGSFELERQPSIGAADAPVDLVIFEDFSCPACARFEEDVFPRIKREFVDTGVVQAHFINFAFINESSQRAANAAECVAEQDEAAFWDWKTIVYRLQGQGDWATRDRLVDVAREHTPQLDTDDLAACIDERRFDDRVQRDNAIARASGVTGTPNVFVNGVKVDSPAYAPVREAILAAQGQ